MSYAFLSWSVGRHFGGTGVRLLQRLSPGSSYPFCEHIFTPLKIRADTLLRRTPLRTYPRGQRERAAGRAVFGDEEGTRDRFGPSAEREAVSTLGRLGRGKTDLFQEAVEAPSTAHRCTKRGRCMFSVGPESKMEIPFELKSRSLDYGADRLIIVPVYRYAR
jgi:hypothetical protein